MNEELAGLDLIGLLGRLYPVIEPNPVPYWPQTLGWLVVGAIILIAAVTASLHWLAVYRADAYRRAAIKAIDTAGDDSVKLATILRRCALAAYPRSRVAHLYGDDWLSFLDAAYGGDGFRTASGRVMAAAAYKASKEPKEPTIKMPELTQLAANWVRNHDREYGRST
ncbi:MAG: DUF4381 domain-containing protein [Hyphomicrobiaceae bacterium]